VKLSEEGTLADARLVDALASDGRCWRDAAALSLSKDGALLCASWEFRVVQDGLAYRRTDVQGDDEKAPHLRVDGARTSLWLRSECGWCCWVNERG
jgi:hypothetical protein